MYVNTPSLRLPPLVSVHNLRDLLREGIALEGVVAIRYADQVKLSHFD
jgi:hypothetical protein